MQKNPHEAMRENLDITKITEKIKNGKLSVFNVPEEFALHTEIVRVERELGLRKSVRRGFDVIKQVFFVEERIYEKPSTELFRINKVTFETFEEYYVFLNGDIYENACYYQYSFDDAFSQSLNLNLVKLREKKSFISETVDDYTCKTYLEEIEEYDKAEKNKKIVKRWMEKFNSCPNYQQLKKCCDNYERAKLSDYVGISFFLFRYAFCDSNNREKMNAIMKFFSEKRYAWSNVAKELCLVYPPDDVFEQYIALQPLANRKVKKELNDFIIYLKEGNVEVKVEAYFDVSTHFYCEEKQVYEYENHRGRRIRRKYPEIKVCRSFETFEEFIEYRNGDLRNCDLSKDYGLDTDFSKYKTDDTTKLPLHEGESLAHRVKKYYENGKFVVDQFWENGTGKIVERFTHTFEYFFDFVAFLKGDLSGADLTLCIGIKNLSDIEKINLSNVKLTSMVCKRLGIPYDIYSLNKGLIDEFTLVEKNEEQTKLGLMIPRDEMTSPEKILHEIGKRIFYVSDLHLMHRIQNAGCKSKEDIIYLIQKIIDIIIEESEELVLVGGDVSSDFSIFELFVKLLRDSLQKRKKKTKFIFILGNHELWSFPEFTLEQIVKKYRILLDENGMYLLNNEIFYENECDQIGVISYNELTILNNEMISEKLRCSRLVILGGVGFSGYNEEFNADNGIYKNVIDRNTEICESKKFEGLYNKLINILNRKNSIILTHMPKADWCKDKDYHDRFVYVSGHNHRNQFFDDGLKRIYADNQIGYCNENVHLKSLLIDDEYDYFAEYEDGIYEITSQNYQDFMRGKNICMTFNRNVDILYMLKKNTYYCFIQRSYGGSLSILNGGSIKKLDTRDIEYYYNNMDSMIKKIKNPLDEYTNYQKMISEKIKKIGGTGRIHGCIIDIDYYNHIYVNPTDMKVTGYWAEDIIHKIVYPSIPKLLEKECPELYSNYKKMIGEKQENAWILKRELEEKPEVYLETDIYRASREIRKMQKLNSNVLTTWYDSISESLALT